MIGSIDIKVNASHPNLALQTLYSFVGSPSSLRILNVPKHIGNWKITSVAIQATYPDNSIQSVVTKLVGGAYVGTLPACNVAGKSTNGYQIVASGTDENGNPVSGYVLGIGDCIILTTDGTITIGQTTYYLHLLDTVPTSPHKGDVAVIDGTIKLYTGTEWVVFGGECYWNMADGKLSPNADVSSISISANTRIDTLSSNTIYTSGIEAGEEITIHGDNLCFTSQQGCSEIGLNEDDGIYIASSRCVRIESDNLTIISEGGCTQVTITNDDIGLYSGGLSGLFIDSANGIFINSEDGGIHLNDCGTGIWSDGNRILPLVDLEGCADEGEILYYSCSDGTIKMKASTLKHDEIATKNELSSYAVKKVNGTSGNVVLFDQLGKIKDSNTALTSLATKSDLNYDQCSIVLTTSGPCINTHSGEFVNVIRLQPCMNVYVYLGDSGNGKVSDTIIQFNYSALTADTQLPEIHWYRTADGDTITWQHVEADEVKAGKQYLYMVQTYKTGQNAYNGIMTIRELKNGLSDE